MQKIRKISCAVFRENRAGGERKKDIERERERERERDRQTDRQRRTRIQKAKQTKLPILKNARTTKTFPQRRQTDY